MALFYVYTYHWSTKYGPKTFHIYSESRTEADKQFKKLHSEDILNSATVTRKNW